MRVSKLHSSLSIAAIAILAAFAPGIAQAQSNGPREDASNLIAAAGNDLAPSFNMNRIVASDSRLVQSDVGIWNLSPGVPAKPRVNLSAEAFKVSDTPAAGEHGLSFGQEFELYQAASTDSKKQNRGDDDVRTARSKWRVEFVPSMGLKMPYQN